jgi:hypothetical protein
VVGVLKKIAAEFTIGMIDGKLFKPVEAPPNDDKVYT